MSDVLAGPAPDRVWAVRFQDGGGWRLIGSEETMRVLRQRGELKAEVEYVAKIRLIDGKTGEPTGVGGTVDGEFVMMSKPLAQTLGYGVGRRPLTSRHAMGFPSSDEDEACAKPSLETYLGSSTPNGLEDSDQRAIDELEAEVAKLKDLGSIWPLRQRLELSERQRDDATTEVARLAVGTREADAAIGAWRERETLLQDDLEQREAALGRALALVCAVWDESGEGTAVVCRRTDADCWADVVRWISDTQGGEKDGNGQGDAAQKQASAAAPGSEPPDQEDEPRGPARDPHRDVPYDPSSGVGRGGHP